MKRREAIKAFLVGSAGAAVPAAAVGGDESTALPAEGTFEWALMKMKEGHTLKRQIGRGYQYFMSDNRMRRFLATSFSLSDVGMMPMVEIEATDWEVVT